MDNLPCRHCQRLGPRSVTRILQLVRDHNATTVYCNRQCLAADGPRRFALYRASLDERSARNVGPRVDAPLTLLAQEGALGRGVKRVRPLRGSGSFAPNHGKACPAPLWAHQEHRNLAFTSIPHWGRSLASRLQVRPSAAAATVGVIAASVLAGLAYCWSSLSLHRSFHSNGWDLGLIDQVIWNSAHGRPFAYSFREMSYLGDHFQPFALVLSPVNWLFPGPEALLILQAVVLSAAAVPLFFAARRLAGSPPAAGLAGAYLLSLGVARAVAFDFHVEAFAPLFAFLALLALTHEQKLAFVASCCLLLTLKEDSALLAVCLAWVAWFAFGWRRVAALTAAVSLTYGGLVTAVVIPHFRGPGLNPLRERYGYLGDSLPEIGLHAFSRAHLVAEQLIRPETAFAVALVLLAFAGLPLLVPRLLPPLVIIAGLPLLSQQPQQSNLDLHYLLVPTVGAAILAAIALRVVARGECGWAQRNVDVRLFGGALVAVAAALFLYKSPLPPGLAAEWDRFDIDRHAAVSQSFVDTIPADAVVSAQSPFVPHLAERRHIFEFPRVADAEFVLLDKYGPIPFDDYAAGYSACLGALKTMGFDLVREQEGISLWRRTRPAEAVPNLPPACAGQDQTASTRN